MNVTTKLEKQLLGALGGVIACSQGNEEELDTVFKAAGLDRSEIERALKVDASDEFNNTMWNLCNSLIGLPMDAKEARPQKDDCP